MRKKFKNPIILEEEYLMEIIENAKECGRKEVLDELEYWRKNEKNN